MSQTNLNLEGFKTALIEVFSLCLLVFNGTML